MPLISGKTEPTNGFKIILRDTVTIVVTNT